jgi:hypothetical protein
MRSVATSTLLIVSIVLSTALGAVAGQKMLRPVPSEGQTVSVEKDTKIPIVAQTINGLYVQASVIESGDLFKVGVILVNRGTRPITVEQEKMFVLNAYDRQLYRFPDYEIKAGWARLASLPTPPPPPPRRYYSIEPQGTSTYTAVDMGSGYYSVSGFSPSYRVDEHYDYSGTLGYVIGASIRHALDRRKARKEIEALDQYYFRNQQLAPGQQAEGMIFFQAIAVSNRTPLKLILFAEDARFQFVFQQ